MSFVEDFRKAARDGGVSISGEILADAKIHRFGTGEKNDLDGYYLLFSDGPPYCGVAGCWRRDLKIQWKSDGANGKVDPTVQKRWREAIARRDKEQRELQERAAQKAREAAAACHEASPDHPYLLKKKAGVFGPLRENFVNELLLPLQDAEGAVWSYQTIDADGEKMFMPMGRVKGCFFPLAMKETGPLVICEGYATGATIHSATGWSVVCAMNCGNLPDVARALREKWPNRLLVIASDNDRKTEGNPGLTKATSAAKAIRGSLAVPSFRDEIGSDFNDMAAASGISAVKNVFESVVGAGLGSRMEIDDLISFVPSDDKDSILGKRYLCRGGSCVIVGSTSAGKSSLGLQKAALWAVGASFFGLRPARPLRSLFIQAENDLGDMAEMVQGILLGTGLFVPGNDDHNRELGRQLRENLIIKRDQTHTGSNFGPFVRSLIEIHQPDLVWVDPMLSFFGDDVNNQQAMTRFLRGDLNPISEQTGIIWMLLHHTGKPDKNAKDNQKNWTSRDFAYLGIGSSELSNWARAIITMSNAGEDEFRVVFAKRGWRSGVTDESGNPTTDLYLAHSGDMICWKRIPKPLPGNKMQDACTAFAATLQAPMRSSDIVKLAAKKLKRGERTLWNFWDSGEGVLGQLFNKTTDGLWIPKKAVSTKPYKDD